MIRRLNYTGRVKIHRSSVRLAVVDIEGGFGFDAHLDLDEYGLASDAQVFVEAYRQTTWMRFAFGTVGAMQIPEPLDRRLTEFDSSEGVLFRVKVTQATDEHVLLAAADKIPLHEKGSDSDKESLLPVVPMDLGEELWRLDFDPEPKLLISKSATADWNQLALSPLFQGLVYPEALRSVLTTVLNNKHRDTEDEGDWQSKWLRFATLLPGMPVELPKEDDEDGAEEWVEDAIRAFSKKLLLRHKFSEEWSSISGQ